MRINVFGAGYVGLVTGTCLSDLGHDVIVYDIDRSRIEALSDGRIPIYEPGLGELVRRNMSCGRLHFESDAGELWNDADAYFIAVGTPPHSDGSADLSAVMAATDTIGEIAITRSIVVVKSTVPVGTCDKIQERLTCSRVPLEGSRAPLEVVSNPEFLKEGDAVADFFKPDRVVIGVRSAWAEEKMCELYAPLQLSGERPMIVTDPCSSEMIKYASNAILASRISFMNELARLVHHTGGNIHDVRLGVGSDSRIGKKFLYAGPGYGGSCFPKDVRALAALGRSHGLTMRIAEATHQANEEQAVFLANLVDEALGGVSGKRIALWGLAFKPETDDVRESPAIALARTLIALGATVVGHDPEAGDNFLRSFLLDADVIGLAKTPIEALDSAHALVLLTEWRCYRSPDFKEIRRRLVSATEDVPPVVVDARNIWRPSDVTKAGLRYRGIGVPDSSEPYESPPTLPPPPLAQSSAVDRFNDAICAITSVIETLRSQLNGSGSAQHDRR